jgi:hypothetical protein
MNDSDDSIASHLAAESLRAPRTFRGRPLAPLTFGLRALRAKVFLRDDPDLFHDVILIHLLAEAYAETEAGQLERRRALIAATDDVPTFRGRMSLLMDELGEEGVAEATRLTEEILGLVKNAEVEIAEKKSEQPPALAAPSPIPISSSSSPSPEPPATPSIT